MKKTFKKYIEMMNEKKMRTYYLTVYYTPESEGGDKQD